MENQGNSGRTGPTQCGVFVNKDALQIFPALLRWTERLHENSLNRQSRRGVPCKTSPLPEPGCQSDFP
jgi:hypothetical protein